MGWKPTPIGTECITL